MWYAVLCYAAGDDDEDLFGDFNLGIDDDLDMDPTLSNKPKQIAAVTKSGWFGGLEGSCCEHFTPLLLCLNCMHARR